MAENTELTPRDSILELLGKAWPKGKSAREIRESLGSRFDQKQLSNATYNLKRDALIEQDERDRLYYLTNTPAELEATIGTEEADLVESSPELTTPAMSFAAEMVRRSEAAKTEPEPEVERTSEVEPEREVITAIEPLPTDIEAALQRMAMPAPEIEGVNLKVAVLDRLADLLEPSISAVLDEIKSDLLLVTES